MKLFIADNSISVLERLIDMLSEFKEIEIIGQAKDAINATKSILKLKPDVVILDIRMPGNSGIDVLETIKKSENPPVVIILTNYPYPQYRKRCMDLGADFFFNKAKEFKKIPVVLKKLIRNAQ